MDLREPTSKGRRKEGREGKKRGKGAVEGEGVDIAWPDL